MPLFKLVLLGGFALHSQDGAVVPLPGRKDRLLLSYLALQKGRSLPRERLYSLLWAGRPEAQARNSLRQSLAVLRATLGNNNLLFSDRDTVGLQTAALDVDALEFERLAMQRPVLTETALSLYRGKLLAYSDSPAPEVDHWLRVERQRFENLAVQVVEDTALAAVSGDAARRAIEVGQQLLEHDQLREPLCRALMRLHILRHDRAGALKVYSTCAKVLKNELNAEPELETKQLYREILVENAALGTASSEPLLSVVVLPFTNLSNDPEQQHFADGLTEDITIDLSRISGSFVIARSTAFTYQGKPTNAQSVARELGVRYVLEGSVRRLGEHVRVAAQLIDGTTSAQVWSDRFDHSVSELWRCQDDVTRQIAQILNLELIDAESRRSKRARPNNPSAVDLALQGWSMFNQPASKARLDAARAVFEASLGMDPDLVSALIGMASVCMAEVDRGWSDNPDLDVKRALDLINQTSALEPGWSAAECVRSRIFAYHSQMPEAINAAEAAIALNRNDSIAHRLLALYELQSDRPERCQALIEQDLRLSPRDPNRWSALVILARAQIAVGECDKALANLHRAFAINPDIHFARIWFATGYGRMGNDQEARRSIADFLDKVPDLQDKLSEEGRANMEAQLELAARGYYLGIADGRMGPFGQRAIREFQRDHGLLVTGQLDNVTLTMLSSREAPVPSGSDIS